MKAHHPDIHIAKVIEMMEATDEDGRMDAFSAVWGRLREYQRDKPPPIPRRKAHIVRIADWQAARNQR
ncbi:hypothetical protein [Thiomonas sp.]